MLLCEDIILDSFGPEHTQFRELVKFMLKIDPNERPTASQCLDHPFFAQHTAAKA
jgi:serine/threonine protein kinase